MINILSKLGFPIIPSPPPARREQTKSDNGRQHALVLVVHLCDRRTDGIPMQQLGADAHFVADADAEAPGGPQCG